MSAVFWSLFLGVGVAAFVWSYLARKNGNAQVGSNVIAAAVAGAIAFFVFFTMLKTFFGF